MLDRNLGWFAGLRIVTLLGGLYPLPAAAADWWLVYGEGQRPARSIIFLDLESLREVADPSRSGFGEPKAESRSEEQIEYITIEGRQVFEAESAPAFMALTYLVNCRERLIAQSSAEYLWRNDRTEQLADTGWISSSSSVAYEQVTNFVCDEALRSDAGGMLQATNDLSPLPVTWEVFWADGTQPKWNSARSEGELRAAIEKRRDSLTAMVDSSIALAGNVLQESTKRRDATASMQNSLASRKRSRASNLLDTWLGSLETELVRSWGAPVESYYANDRKFVVYDYSMERIFEDEYGNEFVAETFSCGIEFEILDDQIVGHRSGGNYCQTAADNLPPGR